MKNKIHRDVWMSLVLIIFCVTAFSISVQIPGEAAYLPSALIIMMTASAVAILVKALKKTKELQGNYKYSLSLTESKYWAVFMGLIVLYYLAFKYIGYWVATPVFMIAAQKYLQVKSWKVNLIVTVAYTIICFVLFVGVLKLPIYKVGILGPLFRIYL